MRIEDTKWYKTRPEIIKNAMKIWHLGDMYLVEDEILYLLGYSETEESMVSGDPYDIMLILSKIDPVKDYDLARKNIVRLCAKHFRNVTRQ